MRFLVGAQLPTALARWLAAKNYEAEHVGDKAMQAALLEKERKAVLIAGGF